MKTYNRFLGLVWGNAVFFKRHGLTKSALTLMVCVGAVQSLGYALFIGNPHRWVVDIGLASSSLYAHFFAIACTTSIYQRVSAFGSESLILSRPVGKTLWFSSTWISAWMHTLLWTLLPYLWTWCFLLFDNAALSRVFYIQPWMLCLEVCVSTSLSMLFCSWVPQGRAVVYTMAVLIAGHNTSMLHTLARTWDASEPLLGTLAHSIAYMLPNMEKLSLRMHAAHMAPFPASHLGYATLYAVAYSILCLSAGLGLWKKQHSLER